MNKLDEALTFAEKALEATRVPDKPTSLVSRFEGLNPFSGTRPVQEVKVPKNEAAVQELIGHIRQKKGDLNGALAAFSSFTLLRPNDPRGHVELASVLKKLNRSDEANQELSRALDIWQSYCSFRGLNSKQQSKRCREYFSRNPSQQRALKEIAQSCKDINVSDAQKLQMCKKYDTLNASYSGK